MNLFNEDELDTDALANLKKYVFVVYILQALSFVTLFSGIIGIIVNYIKDDDVRGTWLQSHFDWQKSTFWWTAIWIVVGFIPHFIFIGYAIWFVLTFWAIYRIAKGWIYLVDGKEMYTR